MAALGQCQGSLSMPGGALALQVVMPVLAVAQGCTGCAVLHIEVSKVR